MAYSFFRNILSAFGLIVLCACVTSPPSPGFTGDVRLTGVGGRAPTTVVVGENLQVGAAGLVPGRGYEFDLMLDERRVGFARGAADARGQIAPLILLYQSGVIGCSGDWATESRRRPLAFRDFDEAERALNGRRFRLQLREAGREASETRRALRPSNGRIVGSTILPAARSSEPMVFPSTAEGCLLNSAEAGSSDMYVSGRGFTPGETLELAVAPNQVEWHVDDRIDNAADEARRLTVRVGDNGRFVARVWGRTAQHRGAYDIVARRLSLAPPLLQGPRIHPRDVISSGLDTAYILFLYYPPGGTLMDVAGRKLDNRHPWFQFADSFATTGDDVWGGVDPTYVTAGHAGGTHAAYYVVQHRSAAGWAGATNLIDVSGVIEVGPVKAGCVNGTYRAIWQGSHPVGDYDVVVNFGSVPANWQVPFVDDFTYDSALDYLDGAIQTGFVVADDPNELGPMAVGSTSYSVDNAFALSPAVSAHHGPSPDNVDLRAVVRYPATAPGPNQPVAAGTHPIFIMQHGNHSICNVAGDHVTCPPAQRERNHEGYMRLLDVLASHGIIAVSVDAFDVTGIWQQWIAERADLNLRHLEFWSHLNNSSTYPTGNSGWAAQTGLAGMFTGHVDMTKISVSGHSRGGEASVATYVRNLLRPAAQQFAIGSVSSIAPVDGQAHVLGDVPYFVILPAADGDVWDLSGARIYDRAGTATDMTIKSGIDVYGASHNFFNTVWAADGDDGAPGRADFIPAADQQKIGESYLAAFVLSQLRGMSVYDDMLRGGLAFPSTTGWKIYHFRHEKPFLKLDNGTSATPVGAGLTAAVVASPSVHQTSVKRLNWSGGSQTYTYSLAPTDTSVFEVFSFRVAQTNAAVNPGASIEFQVRLASGPNTRFTYTGSFDTIPRPYDRSGTDQNVMTNVRIPLHSFIMNNSGVNLTGIDTIELKFSIPAQGEIYVDDVEFSR